MSLAVNDNFLQVCNINFLQACKYFELIQQLYIWFALTKARRPTLQD
jgi:hypothetical protein